jgi:hypothetical protein
MGPLFHILIAPDFSQSMSAGSLTPLEGEILEKSRQSGSFVLLAFIIYLIRRGTSQNIDRGRDPRLSRKTSDKSASTSPQEE